MMKQVTRRISIAICALAFAGSLAVAQEAKQFEPHEGQAGKDVIWLPTHSELVNGMLNMAQLTSKDYVIDLGSGDGRTVIAAASRGATALGIEYNPEMVALSQRRAAQAGISGKAQFVRGDIFEADFSKATVVTMFLLPELNMRLRPKLLDLKPGTRIVSNSFDLGDWRPDRTVEIEEGCVNHCEAYLWIVPAKVDGAWKISGGGELKLQQKFQELTGTLTVGNVTAPIANGKVNGPRITFTAGGKEYSLMMGAEGLEGAQATITPFKAVR